MQHVDCVRGFNRFYTGRIGALRDHFVGSPYPLPVARVLYEVGRRGRSTATEIGADLGLDAGYLSRLLDGLKRKALLTVEPAPEDARRKLLALTPAGRRSWQFLDQQSRKQVAGMLKDLSAPEQGRLVSAMGAVESLLGEPRGSKRALGQIALRAHQPGDMGWVVERHAAVYFTEWGWGAGFEALVAGIVKTFLERFDPARERCWIAERDGERVGSVFIVDDGKGIARLRLLLVEPAARGSGLGTRLVEECIRFSRERGYRRLDLWTHSNLDAARAVYRKTGFRLISRKKHSSFGHAVTGEDWSLELKPRRRRGT